MKIFAALMFLAMAMLPLADAQAGAAPVSASPWSESPGGRVRLVAAQASHNGSPALFAIEFDLKPDWHTYWRVPGDSGLAPRFDWAGSRNVAGTDLRWPAPRRFDQAGDASYGYTGHFFIPVLIRAKGAGDPLNVSLVLDYGICANVCVVGSADLKLDLGVGEPEATIAAPSIGSALELVPNEPANPADLSVERVEKNGGSALMVHYLLPENAMAIPTLIAVSDGGIYFDAPQGVRAGRKVSYLLPVSGGGSLQGRRVTLLLSGEGIAIEAERTVR